MFPLYGWRRRYPEFDAACTPSEDEKRAAVEAALFHRATGYSHRSVKILTVDKLVQKVKYTEHYPPDVAAIKYYLNNRDRANWSEKTEVEQSGGVTVKVIGGLPGETEEETK